MPATIARPLVIAHRGASRAEPENTVAAFVAARVLGADWVELDVRRTADGVLAVHHDQALPDGRSIAHLVAADLPPSVPDLASALAACAGMGVNVEVKPHDSLHVVEAVVDVIRSWGGAVLVSSFQAELVAQVRVLAPEMPTGLLVHQFADVDALVASCAAAGHDALHPFDPTVDATMIELAHDAGLAVNVWTVDDPARMRHLAALGVDGIVTNVPDIALAALRS